MIRDNKEVSIAFDYYKDQIFKLLNLFEDGNNEAYKHCEKIMLELQQMINRTVDVPVGQITRIANKLDCLYDELLIMDANQHSLVKNLTFESMNLIEEIQRRLV